MANNVDPVVEKQEFNVSPEALSEVRRLMDLENQKEIYLRIGVVSGGCSGLSYNMSFDNEKSELDQEFDFEGVKVLVEDAAMVYISGATLDFKGSLMGGGFTFVNPNAKRSCGCGSSFRC